MYSGVVFDFDGVLFDSEYHWGKVENRYLASRVPNWSPSEYKHLIGCSLSEAYAYLKSRGADLTENEYFADYHAMADELYNKVAKPLPNVDILIGQLVARKAKIAIASSSKRAWIDAALNAHQTRMPFTVIVSAADALISNGKPAPDVYLRAAELLCVDARMLIAIEDSKNGVTAAKTAGMFCFGLRNGYNEEQDLDLADEIIEGYSTKSIARIMDLIV